MLPPKDIILAYLCPSLGILIANLMFAAPVIDCYKKVKAGKGLQELNPMPWSFMTGNTIGVSRHCILLCILFMSESARVDSLGFFYVSFCLFVSVDHVWGPQAKSLFLLFECAWFCHLRLVESTSCENAV
jgi:hypothetical protein